ncbi:MAG: hypothetical protein QM757_25610 [Paludibaculum sp.]
MPRAQPQLASRLTARRSPMKRQPTTCGSSPWQQVARPLRMPRRRAGLADLVQVRHEAEHLLAFAAEIDQRLAAAE